MQLILVGGAQRSGTTLLQTLLVNGLLCSPLLPEAHILSDILVGYKRAKSQWNKTSKFYSDESQLTDLYRKFAALHIHDIGLRYPQTDYIVLKDPHFAGLINEATSLLLDIRCIAIVRDPRDIVASYIKIGEREALLGIESHYTKRNIGFICRKISDSYSSLTAASKHVTIVTYERLVSNPLETLRTLALEADLTFRLDRIEDLTWLDEEIRHRDPWVTELEGKTPVPSNIGAFRHFLTDNEVAVVERICGDLMERFCYPRVAKPGPIRSLTMAAKTAVARAASKARITREALLRVRSLVRFGVRRRDADLSEE